ncbi:hypothetical protein [Pontibacter chitinilyticus]|uniref:hypothetical protein n=1 Tax=Pontibacter chitinilyticus TaxID=2674989 RepID=UPI00321B328C
MKIIFNILFVLFFVDAWATDQDPDVLYYQGSKYYLYSNTVDSPLESFTQLKEKLQSVNKDWMDSGCWRNFTAEWTIEGGQLYLTKVKNCKDGKEINSLVEKAINKKFVDGKMKADWVNGVYWVGSGERYWNAFENEIKFTFESGAVVRTKYYASPDCSYSNRDTLESFIYSNINWEELPNKREDVSIDFETDSEGKIVQAKVRHSVSEEFEKEALRVLRNVPCWKVFTHFGEVFGWRDIDITFSEKNRKKYTR